MDICIKYINRDFQIGLVDLRNVWLLSDPPVRLPVSVHQANLTYRLPKNGVRVSYNQLKPGLCKCNLTLYLPDPPLPF